MGEVLGLIWLIEIVAAVWLAHQKGRSEVLWFILAMLIHFFALIILLLLPPQGRTARRVAAQPKPRSSGERTDTIQAIRNAVSRANRLQELCNNIIYDIEGTFVEFPTDGEMAQAKNVYLHALAEREQAVHRLERAGDSALMRADPERALSEALASEDTMRSSLARLRQVEGKLFPNRPSAPLLDNPEP